MASTDLMKTTTIFTVKTVKLTKINYNIWRPHQIFRILKGSKILGFVDGSIDFPDAMPNTEGVLPKNLQGLTYAECEEQDNLLMGWLMTAITEEVLPKVCACTSAKQIWDTLAKVFASNSQVRTLQLRLNLQTTKKGNKSMEDYITNMIDIANALALADDKVSDKDLSLFVLGGLGSDYDPLVTAITTRPSDKAFSIDDIQGILLNHEQIRLASNMAPSVENSFSVNYTNRQRDANLSQCLRAAVGSDTIMWFPNSGASTHITSDFENLSFAAPYEGGDKVTIANSTGGGER